MTKSDDHPDHQTRYDTSSRRIEIEPLQPPFPDGTKFIQFHDDDKILAVSDADYRLITMVFGKDLNGRKIVLSPAGTGRICIAALVN